MSSLNNPSDPVRLHRARTEIDVRLAEWLPRLNWHAELTEAARYVVSGGGKAVRPALVEWSYRQWTGNHGPAPTGVWDLALALEFIHSYSLVHDDLPCMDDDDFRRGRPTLHRLCGEDLAVLTGDALLTGAFEVAARSALPDAARVRATLELSRAAGGAGMVAGQVIDLRLKTNDFNVEQLTLNHNLKTGALFGAALELGSIAAAYLSGVGDPGALPRHAQAKAWGVKLGLLFQVVDDVLDADSMGDEGPNFVKLIGLDGARGLASRLESELLAESKTLGTDPDSTREILSFFTRRKV